MWPRLRIVSKWRQGLARKNTLSRRDERGLLSTKRRPEFRKNWPAGVEAGHGALMSVVTQPLLAGLEASCPSMPASTPCSYDGRLNAVWAGTS